MATHAAMQARQAIAGVGAHSSAAEALATGHSISNLRTIEVRKRNLTCSIHPVEALLNIATTTECRSC